MSQYRAAVRYAKSLLDLSIELKNTDVIFRDMVGIDELVRANRSFLLFIQSPIIKHQTKVRVMKAVFDGKVDKVTSAFLELLTRKGRARILHEVAQRFQDLYLDLKGVQRAEVTTAFKLDDGLRKQFEKLVSDVSEKEPQLAEKVDEEIIGGFVLDVGDQRIDTSIKSNLRRIEFELTP